MTIQKFSMTPHTIYKCDDFFRSSDSELPYVKYAAHEDDKDDCFFNPREILTLTLSDGTQCKGWMYEGMTKAIERGPYIVVTKGNCTYVLETGDTNTRGYVGEDVKEAPQKTSELNICIEPWPIVWME